MPKTINKWVLLLLALFLVAGAMLYIFIRQRMVTDTSNMEATWGLTENGLFYISSTPTIIDFGEMKLNVGSYVYIHNIHYDTFTVRAVVTNTSDYFFEMPITPKRYKLICHEWFAMDVVGVQAIYEVVVPLRPHGSDYLILGSTISRFYDINGAGTFLLMFELRPAEVYHGLPCRGNEPSWLYMIAVIKPDSVYYYSWQNTYRLYVDN